MGGPRYHVDTWPVPVGWVERPCAGFMCCAAAGSHLNCLRRSVPSPCRALQGRGGAAGGEGRAAIRRGHHTLKCAGHSSAPGAVVRSWGFRRCSIPKRRKISRAWASGRPPLKFGVPLDPSCVNWASPAVCDGCAQCAAQPPLRGGLTRPLRGLPSPLRGEGFLRGNAVLYPLLHVVEKGQGMRPPCCLGNRAADTLWIPLKPSPNGAEANH